MAKYALDYAGCRGILYGWTTSRTLSKAAINVYMEAKLTLVFVSRCPFDAVYPVTAAEKVLLELEIVNSDVSHV